MSSGRALGIGLLAGGVGILVLLLLWIAVSGAESGGIVLGLLLAFVLAGPLVGGGLYVLSRQRVEREVAAAFASKSRVLEADRLFRADMAGALRALADRPAAPAERLRELAADLDAPSKRGAVWEDAVQLDDSSIETLRRYDDLVRARVRSLRDGTADGAAVLRELRQAVDQRDDLLRGRRPPNVGPSELLGRGQPQRGADALQQLKRGDAVTHEGVDYVVESVATYFDEGQRWRLARLDPTGNEAEPRWVYVGPAGLEVAVLDERTDRDSGTNWTGTAVVDIDSAAGRAEGVLVQYRRELDGTSLRITERWPDEVTRVYDGSLVRGDDLEVWPAAFTSG